MSFKPRDIALIAGAVGLAAATGGLGTAAQAAILPGVVSGGAGGGVLATSAGGVKTLTTIGKATSALKGIGTVASIAGTGAQVVGGIRAGKAQEQQADIESVLAEAGGIAEETRASEERTVAAQLEADRRREGRRDISRAIATEKGRGFAGTPLLLINEFLTDIEADVANIRSTGGKKVAAAEGRSASRKLQGLTLKQLGKAQRTKGLFEGGSSLLTGIGGAFT